MSACGVLYMRWRGWEGKVCGVVWLVSVESLPAVTICPSTFVISLLGFFTHVFALSHSIAESMETA